jgi:HSP20 family protein
MTRNNINALTRFGNEFDNFSKEFDILSHFFGLPTLKGIENNMYIPPISITELKDKYTIVAEIPGTSKEEIEIKITEDGTLVIRGEKIRKNIENEEILLSEIGYGNFRRELKINENVDKENVNATYENGVLEIFIPKLEKKENKIKQIKIT